MKMLNGGRQSWYVYKPEQLLWKGSNSASRSSHGPADRYELYSTLHNLFGTNIKRIQYSKELPAKDFYTAPECKP